MGAPGGQLLGQRVSALDGVTTATSPFAAPLFHDAPELTGEDVERLVRTIRDRVLRLLRRRGLLEDTGQLATAPCGPS